MAWDFFFVISGWFVFAPLLLSPARENTVAFAIRRAFRIYPLFLFAVIFYALLPHKTWDNGIVLQHALFLHTTISKEIAFYYNPAFWSLPVEVEFYLLIGLLVLLKIRNTTPVLLLLAGLTLLTGLWAHHFLPENTHAKLVLIHHLSSILPEFLLGTLAYLISKKLRQVVGLSVRHCGTAAAVRPRPRLCRAWQCHQQHDFRSVQSALRARLSMDHHRLRGFVPAREHYDFIDPAGGHHGQSQLRRLPVS